MCPMNHPNSVSSSNAYKIGFPIRELIDITLGVCWQFHRLRLFDRLRLIMSWLSLNVAMVYQQDDCNLIRIRSRNHTHTGSPHGSRPHGHDRNLALCANGRWCGRAFPFCGALPALDLTHVNIPHTYEYTRIFEQRKRMICNSGWWQSTHQL